MKTCDVVGCKNHAEESMEWPNGRKIVLCHEHTKYYKGIAGPHMKFEVLPK